MTNRKIHIDKSTCRDALAHLGLVGPDAEVLDVSCTGQEVVFAVTGGVAPAPADPVDRTCATCDVWCVGKNGGMGQCRLLSPGELVAAGFDDGQAPFTPDAHYCGRWVQRAPGR